MEDWLTNPLNRLALHKAIVARENTVQLKDPVTTLSITYNKNGVTAWLAPVVQNQHTPCGWFDIKKVSDPIWIATE